MGRTSGTVLNKSGEVDLCHVTAFKENIFNFYSVSMMLAIGFPCVAFNMLRHKPFIPTFLRVFTKKGC